VAHAFVYPLVTTRSLARAFTYEVPDDVGVGAIVSIQLGRQKARGVVAEVDVRKPDGIEPIAVGKVLASLPPVLVELALWLADYYGSTPARALELVAPRTAKRRAERPSPAARESLAGEPEPAELTNDQSAAIEEIRSRLTGGGHVLVVGPTGSGKTEVYLQAAAAALEQGRGVIVLVPEIALAPQTVGRFRARFGDTVAILHSSLGDAERRDERERIASGDARVVVGARSAIFAPMRDVGLIVVDEEHDSAFKQDADPRYDARTVAAKRAALEGAVAVYGSATPRPESWERLDRLALHGRIGAPLPLVRLVDLRREAGYPLSAPLLRELAEISSGGGRAILLLNRRGVAPAVHCRACGVSRRCPSCDVALTLHADGRLYCHHCGYSEAVPRACPGCGSLELARVGAGTQRLEAELEKHVPGLLRIRLDADTTARPGALREALERFSTSDRVVLIGTQMVAKGHHFPDVRLAAVVDADTGLTLPDFRAEERTFQLVTQLAGRSGRDAPGLVLVQTFQPDATPFSFAARHDVDGFLARELERRAELGYPPFRHLVSIVVAGPDQNRRSVPCGRSVGGSKVSVRTCSARRRSFACAAATARSWSRRPVSRAGSPAPPRRCSRRQLLRYGGTASRPSWTSTPSPCSPIRFRRVHARPRTRSRGDRRGDRGGGATRR